jgi:hypothetical protein
VLSRSNTGKHETEIRKTACGAAAGGFLFSNRSKDVKWAGTFAGIGRKSLLDKQVAFRQFFLFDIDR